MIFDSKYYPKFMFLAITVVSLLLLFNVVNIMDQVNNNLKEKQITGFATNIDLPNNESINQSENQSTNSSNITEDINIPVNIKNKDNQEPNKEEIYTTRSYAMYYILIIGIIAGIFITFSILKSTILKNIKIEEEARRF